MTIRIEGEEEEILGHQEVEVARNQVSGTAATTANIRITTSFSTLT
jgi:hypothetical protein